MKVNVTYVPTPVITVNKDLLSFVKSKNQKF